ncbi:MAG TPA: hypothetical protein ENN21_01270 [Spirochaetes bacterium]|nr:hypothetical protein [Spirochaetota bacterium]
MKKSKESRGISIKLVEHYGTGAVFMLFPLCFVAAQLMHPNMLHMSLISNGREWIAHFRGQSLLHAAHALEFLCAPLLIIMSLHYKRVLRGSAPRLGFIGVAMSFTGALMLLANKSVLCLTISAFETLPDDALMGLAPGLDVMLRREGWMALLWLLPLLPLGFTVIGVALFKTRLVPRRQSILLIIGSLMLANPEIELVNFIASVLLALGLIPYAVRLLRTGPPVDVTDSTEHGK